MSNADQSRPAIHLLDSEADRIADLAYMSKAKAPQAAARLIEEIDRAQIHTSDSLPDDVVTMLSEVDFIDENSGTSRSVTLVWPSEANIDEGRLSILSLVGSGLIGMQQGSSIEWPDRSDTPHILRIEKVSQPARPATEGDNSL
ncbi:nucleoside diphosphate kinase regulator [Pseudopontixanthobacter vadosimaris]|uniref:nucleoside diphosphate kinase regulator n=1 Tax=Pseudopontixanthobacter vadosimaris TaxID=2726450 RepID=UPI00147680B3|nr:nucleoside diphosphate kinase regulator [Pseudopontixanthobacter vadosimaris]